MTVARDLPIAYEIAGNIYPRLRTGEDWDREEGVYRCPDCAQPFGELHELGCDIERCPRCRRQFLTCPCRNSSTPRWNRDLGHRLRIGVQGEEIDDPSWSLVRAEIDNLSLDESSALLLERGPWFFIEAFCNGPEPSYFLHIFEGEEAWPLVIADSSVGKDTVVAAFRRVFDGDLAYRDVTEWKPTKGAASCLTELGLVVVVLIVLGLAAWWLFW